MGQLIFDKLSKLKYFDAHPEYLQKYYIPEDPHGRFAVSALVKGNGPRTVILLGHFDIVDYESFGINKKYALHPQQLMNNLDPATLPKEAREDLESGHWIFGRGTGDMKFGVAMEAAYISQLSLEPDFDGNVIFLSVPDEENNSAGMLTALPELNKMKDRYDLEYIGVINSEPHNKDGDQHIMTTGCVGKIMPAIFCVGKEGHAGLLFEGLNAVPMLSEILTDLEFSVDLIDQRGDYYTYPPTSLKINDNKNLYNVTMPYIAYTYLTLSTLSFTAREIMDKLKDICDRAMVRLEDKMQKFCVDFENLTGEHQKLNYRPKVYSYGEIFNRLKEQSGVAFTDHIEAFIKKQRNAGLDERQATINVVQEVIDFDDDKDPKVIIAFIPPFYSHSINSEATRNEKRITNCAKAIKKYSQKKYNRKWKIEKISKQLSDISCCNVGDMSTAAEFLGPNMPLLGEMYYLPIEDLANFEVPPINIGYFAKDYHQLTERMEKNFAFNVAPDLLSYAVDYLLKK